MNLHLFDFDGTISKSDSMLEFFKFLHKSKYFLILLKSLPLFVKYFFNLISKKEFKSKFIINFLSKFSKKELKSKSNEFVNIYESHLKLSALSYIKNLQKHSENEVVIVSASLDLWIKPISKKLNINSITTISKFKSDYFDGISGENCWGDEKVLRIKKLYNPKNYKTIYAYGDSKGDFAMLNLAHVRKYKFFN